MCYTGQKTPMCKVTEGQLLIQACITTVAELVFEPTDNFCQLDELLSELLTPLPHFLKSLPAADGNGKQSNPTSGSIDP